MLLPQVLCADFYSKADTFPKCGIVAINIKTEFMTNCNLDLFRTPPKLISLLPWFLKITVMGLMYRNFEEFFFFFTKGAIIQSGNLILGEIIGKI